MKFQPLDVDSLVLAAQKPTRYVGGEVHTVSKDLRAMRATWALCFPDTYEVGMSNVGFRILYHVLNSRPDVACERVFMPWPDMAAMQRARGVPLWALESRAPVRDFDVLGFSLQFEAAYTTCLEMLDLAGIPVLAQDRGDGDPLVLAGGPCTVNGEPVAPFFDAMVVGEGEEVVGEITDVVIAAKESGASRAELLRRLARVPGVYVPSLFEARYGADGRLEAMVPLLPGYERVERRVVADLNLVPHPERPILPFMQTVHDRLPLELQRGCTRGCRFCQVGMLTRPSRQRDPSQVLQMAANGLVHSGYEEVGFLSLSAGDYACINGLLEDFFARFAAERVAISLPSLRTETMNDRLAEQIGRVRKTGFTIAPEAATDRLRRVINKGNSEENLLRAVESVFRAGWSMVKLYFMIGLPTETDEDVLAIPALAKKAMKVARAIRPEAQINVSVSTFVPKPFTPFQWERMDGVEETIRKHDLLRAQFPRRGPLSFKYHGAEMSMMEGALARGDRRVATAVLHAWRHGQVLDGWTEHFDLSRWDEAWAEMERVHGVSRAFMANRERGEGEVLPWDHIDCGVRRDWLLRERQKSRAEVTVADCATGPCSACGACDFDVVTTRVYREADYRPAEPLAPRPPDPEGRTTVRLRYAKRGRAIAISHLETMTVLLRAIRRSRIPVVYTQGFTPRPRVALGPACPVGVESTAEYLDIDLHGEVDPAEVARALGAEMPPNYEVLEAQKLARGAPSLSVSIAAQVYAAELPESVDPARIARDVEVFRAAERVEVARERPGRPGTVGRMVDLKAAVLAVEPAALRGVRFTLRAGNEASAKPSEVIAALFGMRDGVRLMKECVVFAEPRPAA